MSEDKPIKITSEKATEAQKEWLSYYRESRREEPKRLEDAAKFLSGMISICITIFLTSDRALFKEQVPAAIFASSLLFLIALLLTFVVFMPLPYPVNDQSPDSIAKAHRRVVRWKGSFLGLAALFFVAGLVVLTWAFWQVLVA